MSLSSLRFPGILHLTAIVVLEFDVGRKPSLETPEMKDLDTQFPNCVSDPITEVWWFDMKGIDQAADPLSSSLLSQENKISSLKSSISLYL